MLPSWIDLPTPRTFAEIDFIASPDGDDAYILVHDGEIVYGSSDIYDVYEHAKEYNFEFTAAAIEASGSEETWLGVHLPRDDGMITLMLAINDVERWDMLQNDYHQAVENIETFRADNNAASAFDMLDTHPAFWTRRAAEPTWDWQTNGHMQDIWFAPTGGGWTMEAGGHTDDFTSKFHDLRLDVYGNTFNDALIELAQKVDKFFNVDGTEIPDVEYEKSNLELHLDEVMKGLEDD